MSYLSDIKEYSAYLPKHMQKEFLLQVRKLKNDGMSYEWIYRALTNKEPNEFVKYGFGLLWTASYRAQITKLIETEKKQLEGINLETLSWEELFEEEGEPLPQEQIEIEAQPQEETIEDDNFNENIFKLLNHGIEINRNSNLSPTAELDYQF